MVGTLKITMLKCVAMNAELLFYSNNKIKIIKKKVFLFAVLEIQKSRTQYKYISSYQKRRRNKLNPHNKLKCS